MTNQPSPMSHDHLLKKWMQHELIPGVRLQLMAAMEIATAGGWYLLCKDEHPKLAFGLVLAVTWIFVLLAWMMKLDIEAADGYRDEYEKRFKPPPPLSIRGRVLVVLFLGSILLINVFLMFYECSCLLGDFWQCKL